MPFVRRKRGRVLLVQNERVQGSSRIKQRELYGFGAPSELAAVLLDPAEWRRWTEAVAWRERGIDFDWPAIRERLWLALEAWEKEPRGATQRKHQKIERLVGELAQELAQLTLAKAADAALVEGLRGSLEALQGSIERLLGSAHEEIDGKELLMTIAPQGQESSADAAFEEGMERWWSGDRTGALKHFRRALSRDPEHADAHNHLGIAKLDARRLSDAERHFRAAVEGGERGLVYDGDQVPWGFIENRPHLRALGNLALVLSEKRKWAEALSIQERLLRINPDDNQGVRFQIGFSYLRSGDEPGALAAFEATYLEEVGCAFGLALVRLKVGAPSEAVGEALLSGFAANRYVAPILLGVPWTRLDAFHGTNMAEPEWADEAVEQQADLWHAVPRGAEVLRFWWSAGPVVTFREKLDEQMIALRNLRTGAERAEIARSLASLRSVAHIREVVQRVRAAS